MIWFLQIFQNVNVNDNMAMSGSENFPSSYPGYDVAQQQYSYDPEGAYTPDQLEADATNQLPSYIGTGGQPQFMLPYAYAGYNPEYALRASGYRGYLLPEQQQEPEQTELETVEADDNNPLTTELSALMPSLRQVGSVLGRSLAFIFGLFGVTVLGGGITTAICTLTPLCTISFALPFIGLRTSVRELSEVASKSSATDASDKVARTVNLLQSAMKKFQEKSVDATKVESGAINELESESVAAVQKAVEGDVSVENKDKAKARK